MLKMLFPFGTFLLKTFRPECICHNRVCRYVLYHILIRIRYAGLLYFVLYENCNCRTRIDFDLWARPDQKIFQRTVQPDVLQLSAHQVQENQHC